MSGNGFYSRKTVDVTEVHSNIDQRIIQITEDKLTLILNEHLSNIEMKNSWMAPLGILATLLVVFATTDFKTAFFSADTWQAIFIISTILTVVWLIKSLYRLYQSESISTVLAKIKQEDC
ncbi:MULTISPECIES: hypothetical protein [Chromohalobacter]|uniref:hypothetical protein n=1 Tax=Chromohalobacter TaxID=42054 RepID=UPI001FFCEF52|nr:MULTISPECIES: hypothetical protein [Chromohalobacter]MCK2045596.1 hypothetical protein [Chromohalobacter moromii]MCT8468331.1 hypothetical protein [Chromohalobacter canadensis]MCT8471386.1 hypothetical protein [Chromohalobacter canadensis]MCT8498839.1 hypothetical protein [Chromohalobacter canadensis]